MSNNEVKTNNNGKEKVINENLSDTDFLLSESATAISIKKSEENGKHEDRNILDIFKKLSKNLREIFYHFLQELKEGMNIKNWTSRDIISFFPTIIATTIYMITLTGCYDTEFECLEKYPLHILKYLLYAIFVCGFLFTLQFILYFYDKSSKLQVISTIGIMIFLLFVYDTGTELKSHGAYNRIVLFITIFIWGLIYSVFYMIFFSINKKPILTILIIFTIIFFSYLKIKGLVKNSCEGWEIGFKGSIINNMNSKCKVYPPKTCYYKIFDGMFDVSKLFGESCKTMPTNKWSNNEKYAPDKTAKIIGYPRTERYLIFPDSNYGNLQKKVISNLINMEDPYINHRIKDHIEVTTNYHKNPPEVTINLKYDDELVKERAKIFKQQKENVLSKNVLFIFIDSLSRTNLRRKLPKFYKWIEDKYIPDSQNNNNGSQSSMSKDKIKYESFQFLKYHGVGRYTGVNMVPAYFGVFNIYYMGQYFLTQYKNKGYITGQTLTYCGREVFDLDGGAIEKMKWDTYDHEMVSLFCDGNFTPYEANHYPLLTGANSLRIRCLYNKSALSYSLEYMDQFWKAYEKEPKFFRIGLTEAHEGTNEVIKYSDDELFNFFYDFEKKGHLNDTIVYIQSDHGLSMLGPYSAMALDDYEYELVLPAFFMILPTNMNNYDQIRETVRYNENSMITPFSIYNSLHAIVNYHKYSYFDQENDIFFKKTQKSNECSSFKDYDYYFNHEFLCRCNE